MRFDLIVNTMYKSAITQGEITVNNPSIWRPILDIRDAVTAYIRAIQADISISGVFNIASDNFTVGQVGDLVKEKVQKMTGKQIRLNLKQIHDFRNYKVTMKKAKTYLGYEPRFHIDDTVEQLYLHQNSYGDMENDNYYNIRVFKKMPQVVR